MDLKRTLLLAAAGLIAGVSAENLLKGDTSFETEHHTLTSGNLDPGYMPVHLEKKEAFHGSRSLRVDWDKKNRRLAYIPAADGWLDNAFCMDTVDLKNGEYYTFSFYAKAEHDKTPIHLHLDPNAAWNYWPKGSVYGKRLLLSKEWKRYSYTFQAKLHPNAPYRGYNCWITVKSAPVGKIYFDAFQVNQGKAAAKYVPSSKMSCGVTLDPYAEPEYRDTEKYIYYPGDKINGRVRIVSNDGKGGVLHLKVIDHRKKVLLDKKQKVKGGEEIPLKFDSQKRGWFKITADVMRGKELVVRHTANFAVIDKPVKVAPGMDPFFAMITHAHFSDLMKRIGVGRIQVSACWKKTYRPGVENVPGKLDYRSLDGEIKRARKSGLQVKFGFSPFRAPKWYFDEKLWNEASKYAHGTDSLSNEKSLARWKEIALDLIKKYGKDIAIWDIGSEDNGVLGTCGYFRANHPEYLIDNWVCQGEVFNRFYDAIADTIKEAKKIKPDLRAGIIRPSQGIEGTNWIYIQKVFERIGKSFDVFPVDIYLLEPYRVSPTVKGHLGSIDGRVYSWNLCQSLIKKYGKNQRVFQSEAGLEGDTLFPDESRWEVERAELMAKDFLICRALGFFAYDCFCGVSSYISRRFSFGLSYNHRIQIALPAIAAAARVVENVTEANFKKLPGAARLCTYKKIDGSGRAAVWADKGYYFRPVKGMKITVLDMMGNRIAPDKQGRYMLSVEPVLLECGDYNKMMKQIADSEFGQTNFCVLRSDVSKKGMLDLRIDNNSSKRDLRLELTVSSGGKTDKRELSVATGAYRLVQVPVAGDVADVRIYNTENKGVITRRIELPEIIKLRNKPVRFGVVSGKEHLLPNESWTPWSGRDDFSADFFGSWDKDYLHLEVRVKDDRHFNKFNRCYTGDSLQLAVDPLSNAGIQTRIPGVLGKDDIEFAVAFSTKYGKKVSTTSWGPKSLPGENNYSVVRDEKKKTTLYKVRIPWKAMKIAPVPGKVFGMSLVLFDDDTNSKFEYFAPIGRGIAGRKNPEAFLKFSLEK